MPHKPFRQNQLVLPLLEAFQEIGGHGKASDVYDAVATKLEISPEQRDTRVEIQGRTYNAFERSVRWAQQRAKRTGLLQPLGAGDWTLTQQGKASLRFAKPGLIFTVFVTERGEALFANCEEAVGLLDDGSVNLIFTSPPYPLLRKKEYGNEDEHRYVDWFLRVAEQWPRKLAKDGSIVLNLGDAWRKGEPTLSLYQERLLIRLEDKLGLKLCQRFAWNNPSKMPAPAEWVTVRRVRVKPSLENIFWLSASNNPHADNRNVLVPYSEHMQRVLACGGQKAAKRPAGYNMLAGAFGRDNGGAIPGNLLQAANTESNSDYIRACKENGLPVHPARFPAALPEFFIRLLTQIDDHVFDPFGGSLTTAAVAERLQRRWTSSDCVLDYLEGGRHRFPAAA